MFKKLSKKKKLLLAAIGILIIAGIAVFLFINTKKKQMKDSMMPSFTVEILP